MKAGNFYFLTGAFQHFYEQAHKTENYLLTDSEVCAIFGRKSLEEMVQWMFETDEQLKLADDDEERTLSALMYKPAFGRIVEQTLFRDINILRKTGNLAVHTSKKKKITDKDAYTCVLILHGFAQWLVSYYGDEIVNLTFNLNLIGNKASPAMETLAAEAPLAQDNITQTENGITYHSPSEQLTRELYIDVLLKEAGWIVGNSDTKVEYQLKYSTNGLDCADYVLFGNDGKALAVVEAKKTEKDGRDKGLGQAKRYAHALQKEFGTRPIIFATNGFEHYIWDDLNYPYRPVQGFYSKEDLETLINRRIIEKPLADQAVDVDIAGRYYQIEAIQRAKETLAKGNRDLLFIMATGSGKTRTAAALVDVLTKVNKVKRILFLADRNPLVTQAKGNFNDYLPQLTSVNLGKDKNSDQVRMVFSTYQTMINCIDTELKDDRRLFTCGYFDLVIFDEVHRSIYQKYKAIFNYFDAIRLGLTATPKAETHKDTYELFHLETGVPTFSYELNKAVDDNFLKPPKTLDIPLKFPREGIKYADLSEADKLKYEETFADSEENIPDEINSSAVNEWLFNENTVNQMIQLLMVNGQKVNNGDTIGKTIIFAKNQAHARFILECFDKMYPQFKGHFMEIVTHSSDKPEEAIDLFKQANKLPQIVVSVDMLDTGIDVPEILNLVFFKSVKSSAKYWQMVGRGTRLCPNIFGKGADKEYFLILDFLGNAAFFGANPDGIVPSVSLSVTQRIFLLRLKLSVALESMVDDEEMNSFRKQLLNELQQEVAALNKESFINRPHLRLIENATNRNYWDVLHENKVRAIQQDLVGLLVDNDPDFDARRFDVIVYKLMDAHLNDTRSLPKLIETIKSTATQLLKKDNIPQIAAKKELLRQAAGDVYWQHINLNSIEHFRLEIRSLFRFIEKEKQLRVYTNFEDEVTGDITAMDILTPYIRLPIYQERVASFIRKHSNVLVINKIKTNQPISVDELEQIRNLLFEEDADTAAHLDQVLNGKSFVSFIRSIIGVDATTAKELFAEFINRPNVTAEQMTFMNKLIDFLTKNGSIDPEMLFDRPFTDINQDGVSGVFKNEDAEKIISIIHNFNKIIA